MSLPTIEMLKNVQYNLMLWLRVSGVIPVPPPSPHMWTGKALPSMCVSLITHFCHKLSLVLCTVNSTVIFVYMDFVCQ